MKAYTLLALFSALLLIGCKKKAPEDVINPTVAPAAPASSEKVPNEVVDMAKNFSLVYFDTDSASLTAASKTALDSNVRIMTTRSDIKLEVQGHADERGTTDYNISLGQRRAQTVYNYMKSRGVADSRMKVISYGEEKPMVSGHSESAWSQNRRCEFVITWSSEGAQ